MAGKSSVKTPKLLPRFRVVCGDNIALGPGKMELLSLLVETGSLNEAAKRLNMSYMRAWTLVQTMNKCFREPVVIAERGGKTGGGMEVTAAGRRLLELYQQMEKDSLHAVQKNWRALQRLLRA
jgi:molybdate transport system regulatory protein